ncbi:MAG: sporulation protein YabP [Peptococcaceae bacterium]|nr:sporulation protein YabP [Peptococcaceae bacterium]
MNQRGNQKLTLIDRKELELVGVSHVGSFDEREIILDTTMGVLCLRGEGLHITKLNLEEGTLSLQGFISVMEYREDKSARRKGKNMLSRLIR